VEGVMTVFVCNWH